MGNRAARCFQASCSAVLVAVTWSVCPLTANCAGQQAADLILRGGKIVTLDERRPVAQALVAHGEKITALGSDKELNRLVGADTTVIDLDGRLAIPGFIESHGHFVALGRSKKMLDLADAQSWEDIVRQVKTAAGATPPGHWIVGRGWHQEKWHRRPDPCVEGYPTHSALTLVAPDHPVLLRHATGHMSVANAKAMRLAGVDGSTPNPDGGEILRDDRGRPTGVFRESAQELIERAYAPTLRGRTKAEQLRNLKEAIRLATVQCLAHGVTSFQDAGAPLVTIDVLKDLARRGELGVRLWVMINESNAVLARHLDEYAMVGVGNQRLTVRAIKRLVDGALGSHGAWLLAPYQDLPSSSGLNTTSIESIRQTARLAVEHDCQLCVHAIGDRANRETLDLFEEISRQYPSRSSRRWRIEHAQHLHPDDIPRFAKLDVIASMQGIHCTSDGPFVVERLGEQRAREGAYAWRSLLDCGVTLANGTDVPVEDIGPIECFYASVTRKLPSGAVFFPSQRMTRTEALRSYTLDAAYAAFEEDTKGSLAAGKLADIVVLSRDIMTISEDEILDTRIDYTVLGGKIVYRRVGAQVPQNQEP